MIKKFIKKIQDKLFLSKQKSLLLAEKKRLEKQAEIDNKFPQYGDTEEANASEVAEFTKRKGIAKRLKGELKDVNDALAKIEKNKYGICEICKNPIEKGRLKIIPSARTCVADSGEQTKKHH